MGNLTADQAGIAALWHDRGRGFVGELDDLGHLLDRARSQHHRCATAVKSAPLDQIGLLLGRIGDGIFVPHDRRKAGDQLGGGTNGRAAKMRVHTVIPGLKVSNRLPAVEPCEWRGAAACRSRSLMASPISSSGMGTTAIDLTPEPSSMRK